MTTAVTKVHLANGPWAGNGGWEYNAVLIAAVLSLVEAGPGELSLDHALGTTRTGPVWALGALATGVAAAALAMAAGSRGAASPALTTDNSAAQAAHADTAGDPSTRETPSSCKPGVATARRLSSGLRGGRCRFRCAATRTCPDAAAANQQPRTF
jgi:hypothetical protein